MGHATASVHAAFERRCELRISGPFTSLVISRTAGGSAREQAIAEDISGKAVRLRLRRSRLRPGANVAALVRVVGPDPCLFVRGRVLRVDDAADDSQVAVIALTSSRWLVPSRRPARHGSSLYLVHRNLT